MYSLYLSSFGCASYAFLTLKQDINEISGGELKFPIIGDKDRSISTTYDMLDYQDATNVDAKGMPFTVRTVFVSEYPVLENA